MVVKTLGCVMLNSKRLNAFSLKFRNKARMSAFTLSLINIVLEVLATAIRQEKNKGIQIAKEENKTIPICR